MDKSINGKSHKMAKLLKSSLEKIALQEIYQDLLAKGYMEKFKELESEADKQKTEIRTLQDEIKRVSTLPNKEQEAQIKGLQSQIASAKEQMASRHKEMGQIVAEREREIDGYKQEIEKLRAIIQESDESSLAKIEDIQRKEAQIKSLESRVSSLKSRISKAKPAESKAKIVRKPPKRPDRIDFEYRFNEMGLISMVAMKAEGYSDIVIDVVRGSNYRFKNLEIKVK